MTSKTTRSVVRFAVVVVAAATAGLTGGVAAAAAGNDPKGQPAVSTPRLAPTSSCTLRPSAGKSRSDEYLSCLAVSATLDRVPAVGATATLTATVQAGAAFAASEIQIQLPPQLTWAKAPAGTVAATMTAQEPERAGTLSVARLNRSLTSGQTVALSGVVRAVKAGAGEIRVTASAPDGPAVQAGEDSVFVTVGEQAAASGFGFAAKTGELPVAPAHPTTVAPRLSWQKADTARAATLPTLPTQTGRSAQVSPNLACDTRATGNWGYFDQNSAWHNSMNFQIQIWDTVNGLIGVGITDFGGNYNVCFDSALGHNVAVHFVSEVQQWRVQTGGNPMIWGTGVWSNVVPGSTLNFGSLTSGDPNLFRGLHAYDEANDAWLWIPKPVNGCFDQNDAVCRQLRINWAADSVDGTYYQTGSNDVHLAANDPNAAITVVHEISHAVMDDVYNDAFPPAPSCNPHSIQGTSSAGCAWTEGFAEWLPATVYNDPFFRWPSGASLDLENASWGNGWGQGDTTEGRIAGSLIDITDFNNETTWDRYGEGPLNIWFTFTHHVSNTLSQFWSSRAGDGFNVADSGALADLYQNTVDYGFRDPLGDYATVARPTPTPHNYSYNTRSIYWSAVAVRPPAGSDYDLTLYDDRNQTTALATSAFGGSTIDFVVVDSNLRALGDYYPRAYVFAGSGSYSLELAQGTQILNTGSQTFTMGSSEIVAVRDTFLTAGVPVTIAVTPTNAGQDPELFLFGDDPAVPSSFVKARPAASAASTFNGAGATESVTFTPTRSGWFGVVVTNKAGSGNYTLSLS
jgi:hypothetical protein